MLIFVSAPPTYIELYRADDQAVTIDTDDEGSKKVNSYGETNWAPQYQYYTYGPP